MSYPLTSVELFSVPREPCPAWDGESAGCNQDNYSHDHYDSSNGSLQEEQDNIDGDVGELTQRMEELGLPNDFSGRKNSGKTSGRNKKSNSPGKKKSKKHQWNSEEWLSGFDGQTCRSYLFNTRTFMSCWLPPNGLDTMSLKLAKVDQMSKAEEKIVRKWWWRRFKLFSRYDWGIALDAESWYR